MGNFAKADDFRSGMDDDELKEWLRKRTFSELLAMSKAVEDMLDIPDEAFDAESIVGQLIADPKAGEAYREVNKERVDGLQRIVSELEAYGARTRIRANRLLKRARASENRAGSLMRYVQMQMEAAGFELIRGNEFVAKRKRAANPSLVHERDATAADFLDDSLAPFIEEIPVSYHWKTDEVKAPLKTFYKAIQGQPECPQCKGRKRMVVGEELRNCNECLATGVVIPSDVEVPVVHAVASLEWSYRVEFDEADQPPERKPKRSRKGKEK